jgi:N-acetylglutamate synthase-like GNAT family acetyltransferase
MNDGKASEHAADIVVSTDISRFDLERIYAWLHAEAYWCKGLPRDVFDRAIRHSLCFGALTSKGEQTGFARIISDQATYAYLCDVFVFPQFRGKGISKAMMEAITADPRLQGLRRVMLATSDAHELYAQYGFKPLASPERLMEKTRPRAYERQETRIA